MRIIQSNLSPEQNSFIGEEMERTLAAARNNHVDIPELDVRLEAVSLRPIEVDEAPFAVYADRKREEQRYALELGNRSATIRGGGYPGVLHGLYALLRHTLGAEWTGLDDCDIVFHASPAPEKLEIRPQVPFRGMNGIWPQLDKPFVFRFLRYMARNQWNMLMFHAWRWEACAWRKELLEFAALCAVEFNIGGHSMENFFPESLFGEHPEFFGERQGKRCVKGPVALPDLDLVIPNAYIQPCFSNPEACDHIAGNIAEYIASRPEIKIFSLWPHDGANNWCQCPNCLDTTPYDQILLLAERVLARTARPIYLEVLAYCSLLTIPREQRNLDRIYTIFCPYLRHYRHRFYDAGFNRRQQRLGRSYPEPDPVNPDDDRDYGLLLDDWMKYLEANHGTLGVFAYYQLLFFDEKGDNDRSRYLRFPNTELVAGELRRFMELGMLVYYDCSCPYPNTWPDARLYCFHSRLLFDPETEFDLLIGNQEKALLGDAAPIVDSITDALDRDIRIFDETIFSELDAACDSLPSDRARRVRLWGEYVRLGCESFSALQRGNREAVGAAENAIVKLFEDNSEVLKNHVDPIKMRDHARRFMAPRIRERKEATNIIA